MADIHNKETRSYNMSQVKGKNTKPEMLVRKFLFSKGLRFRLHDKKLPGKPDIVLKKYRTVIFVNGCFWHGHKDCKYAKLPESNKEFWQKKIDRNIELDEINKIRLSEAGWKVIELWQCDLKKDKTEKTLQVLADKIKEA